MRKREKRMLRRMAGDVIRFMDHLSAHNNLHHPNVTLAIEEMQGTMREYWPLVRAGVVRDYTPEATNAAVDS